MIIRILLEKDPPMKKQIILFFITTSLLVSNFICIGKINNETKELEVRKSELLTIKGISEEIPYTYGNVLPVQENKEVIFIQDSDYYEVDDFEYRDYDDVVDFYEVLLSEKYQEWKKKKEEEQRRLEEQKRKEAQARAQREAAAKAAQSAQGKSSSNTPASSTQQNNPSPVEYGNAGLLVIPAVGISVKLNTGSSAQWASIVDAPNSAAIFNFGVEKLIADHNYQGFSAIGNLNPGDKVYIKTASGTTTYIVTERTTGYNRRTELYTADGRAASKVNAGGICMYTCRGDTVNVWVVFCRKG